MSSPRRLRPISLFLPKWDEEALRKKYNQEPRAFERGFRLRAFSDEETSFPDYVHCRVHGVSLGELQRSPWPCFTGVDLSSKKRPGNAIVTVKVDPVSRRRYPIDVRAGKWKVNETCDQITEVNSLYNPVVVMVEDNGFQASLIEHAETNKARYPWWLKIEPTTTTSETKFSQEKGLPVLQMEFAHRAWVIPYDEFENARPDEPGSPGHWARFDYEFRNHPLAASTDMVMATLFCRQGIELHSHSFGLQPLNLEDLSRR